MLGVNRHGNNLDVAVSSLSTVRNLAPGVRRQPVRFLTGAALFDPGR
jgi:hypothetical protein